MCPSLKNLLKTMKRGKDSIFASSKHPKPLIFSPQCLQFISTINSNYVYILTFINLLVNQVLLISIRVKVRELYLMSVQTLKIRPYYSYSIYDTIQHLCWYCIVVSSCTYFSQNSCLNKPRGVCNIGRR